MNTEERYAEYLHPLLSANAKRNPALQRHANVAMTLRSRASYFLSLLIE